MPPASQKSTIWTVLIVGIVLLLGMFMVGNSIKGSLDDQSQEIQDNLAQSQRETAAGINNAQTVLDQRLDTAISDLTSAATRLENIQVETPEFPDFDSLCENVDGCNGYRLSSDYRDDAVTRVVNELTENNNRDLYRQIEDLWDIDENEDITHVSLHAIGRVRSNEEIDSDFDLSDSTTIYVELVLKVKFHEDGESDTTTKYVRFVATIDDLEDGILESDGSEVEIMEVESWRRDRTLTSN